MTPFRKGRSHMCGEQSGKVRPVLILHAVHGFAHAVLIPEGGEGAV